MAVFIEFNQRVEWRDEDDAARRSRQDAGAPSGGPHNLMKRLAEKTGEAAKRIAGARAYKAKDLDLTQLELTSSPPEIAQLSQLQWFTLNDNQLTSLPPEIAQLTQLRELHLDANKLRSLPPEIAQLTQLRRLHLSINQLRSLPPEIAQLTQLQWLHAGKESSEEIRVNIWDFDGNRVLVRGDTQEGRVYVAVFDAAACRRRALTVIRAAFRAIHVRPPEHPAAFEDSYGWRRPLAETHLQGPLAGEFPGESRRAAPGKGLSGFTETGT